MPRTSLIAQSADRLDPWGFGTTAADEPTAVLDVAGIADDDLTGLAPFESRPDADGDTDHAADADDAVAELVARLVNAPRATPVVRPPWPAAVPLEPAPIAFAATPADPRAPAADAEASGSGPLPAMRPARGPAWAAPRGAAAVLALFVLIALGQVIYIGLSLDGAVGASPAPTGQVVLSSHPAGARVTIDGQDQGVTPLVAAVPVGRHQVHLTGADGVMQTLEANVSATARWARHVVLAPAVAAAAALRIDTTTPGAAVWLDGQLAGRTPLALLDMAAGDHAVRVRFTTGAITDRRVVLAGGETVSLVFDTPPAKAPIPAGPASGWVRVQTSFDVQVLESGHVVGTSASERILVTAGAHAFELVNAALGYRASTKVVVGAGRTEAIVVDTPRTAVQVNAQPWAEVLVDGRVLGETPLANLMLPIGSHQFTFRHPDLGERTQPVTVRLNSPNRVTADLRGKL